MFDKKQLAEIAKTQQHEIHATRNFINAMNFEQPGLTPATVLTNFDSLVANANAQNMKPEAFVPAALQAIFDHFGGNQNTKRYILDSVRTGISMYRNNHGGDMPRADLVASALCQAALIYDGLSSSMTGGIFDSATGSTLGEEAKTFYDSLSSMQSNHSAEVPSLAMVTITQTIANALPLIAYLPNPRGTQTVPLVYVRNIAGSTYGQTLTDDYLDGYKAAAQYFDNNHHFNMTTADNQTYTLTAKRWVEPGTFDPAADAPKLPLVAGANVICIGGLHFADDDLSNRAGGKTTGIIQLMRESAPFELDGVSYTMTSGTVNLETSEIKFTLDKALPADTKVFVECVANFEALDTATRSPILHAPMIDVELDYQTVTAQPDRAIYRASIDSVTQMMNELGVDPRAAFIAIVISKLMLEKNARLLSRARAVVESDTNLHRQVDLMRGADATAAFNNTAAIAAEIIPAIEDMKRRMAEVTSHHPSGHDIFVTGSLSTLVRTLADDTNFIPTAVSIGAPSQIQRLGSRGADNYYYLPSTMKVLTEGEAAGVQFGEMMIIGRNAEAAKSVFIGHVAVPVITEEVKANVFEKGVTFYTRQAAQMTRNSRYVKQIGLLRILNMPKSLTSKLV
jgi:hypothetical protein